VISGYPASGKTHRANQLQTFFESKIAAAAKADPTNDRAASERIARLRVHHVSDDTLGLSRSVYATAREEKNARAAFYSAVKRNLTRDSIVIADGLNYIKGYRYQLHCEAKEAQTPSCVVSRLDTSCLPPHSV
jgi:protein KTI12